MLYDEAYSFDVSLSEILDEFLYDDTCPEIVLNFLSNYPDKINEIFNHSACYKRIFQADFYFRCTAETRKELLSLCKKVKPIEYAYLCWQLCSKYFSDKLTFDEKSQVKDLLKNVLSTNFPHPYANRHETYIKDFDEKCSQCIYETKSLAAVNQYIDENGSVPDAENDNGPYVSFSAIAKKWKNFGPFIDYSLFKWRFLQYDVFANLQSLQKYMYISAVLSNLNISDLEGIQLQIYDSDENLEVKHHLYDKVTSGCYWSSFAEDILKNDPEILKIVRSSSTFEEIQFQVSLLGILPPFKKIALWCLLNRKKKILKGWCDYDVKHLDESLNISKLIPFL